MDEITVLVEPGKQLPNPGTLIDVNSPLTGSMYQIKVKTINSLRWNNKGDLVVDIKGTKQLQKAVN